MDDPAPAVRFSMPLDRHQTDPFNQPVSEIRMTNVPAREVLLAALHQPPHEQAWSAADRSIDRPMSIEFPGGLLLDALNAIPRARRGLVGGRSSGHARPSTENSFVVVSLVASDLTAIGMDIPLRRFAPALAR